MRRTMLICLGLIILLVAPAALAGDALPGAAGWPPAQLRPLAQTALATINGVGVVDPDPTCGRTFTVHVNVTNQSGSPSAPGTVTLVNIHRGTGSVNYTGYENYPSIPPQGNYVVVFNVKINVYDSRGQELQASTGGSTFATKYDIKQGDCSKPSDSSAAYYYTLRARQSDKCMDVQGASTASGTQIQQYSCHGSENQQWDLRADGSGYYEMIARHSGKCLDIKGASDADQAMVQQYNCTGGDNQKFRLARVSDDYYLIVAKHSNKCLDVKGNSSNDGAPVQQFYCHAQENQQWRLR